MSQVGSDSNDGLSPATAWLTLIKLSSESLAPGDSVLFHSGHLFRGTYHAIVNGGSAAQPVYIGIYNGTAPAVISGAVPVTSWVPQLDGVYLAPMPQNARALFANGRWEVPARHPNTGWLRISNGIGNTGLESEDLVEPNGYWTQATVRVRTHRMFYETKQVLQYTTGQILFAGITWEQPKEGYGFYLDGVTAALDTAREWVRLAATQQLLYIPQDGVDPNTLNMEASVYNFGISFGFSVTGVTIENIIFEKQAETGVRFGNGAHQVTVRGCTLRKINAIGVRVQGNSEGVRIENCVFSDILGSAVILNGTRKSTVRDNAINRIGLVAGHGIAGTWHGTGVVVDYADSLYIGYNTIDSIGGPAVHLTGKNDTIERNVIRRAVQVVSNQGALVMFDPGTQDISVNENFILHTYGNCESCDDNEPLAHGVYVWSNAHHLTFDGNTVAHASGDGIHLGNGSYEAMIKDNLVYNAANAQLFAFDGGDIPVTRQNDTYINNVLYSLSAFQQNYYLVAADSSILVPATDSNYYFNPYSYAATSYKRFEDGIGLFQQYPLRWWQLNFPTDVHSKSARVSLRQYANAQALGGTLVNNGFFTNNFNNWEVAPEDAVELLLDNFNQMDDGSSKIVRTNFDEHYVQLASSSLNLLEGQLYQLSFSAYGLEESALRATVYDFGGGFEPRSHDVWYRTGTDRRDVTDYFTAEPSDFEQRLKFTMTAIDSVYWFDNISIVPVTATKLDSTFYNRLLINPTDAPVTFSFGDSTFFNLDSVPISSVTLQPYQSTVVIYIDELVTGSAPSIETKRYELVAWPNPADRFVNVGWQTAGGTARYGLFDARGALVESGSWEKMPARLSTQSLPAGLYLLRVTQGQHVFQTKVSVVR